MKKAWPAVIAGCWTVALLVVLAGLVAAPAGLAGAPEADLLPTGKLLHLAGNSLFTAFFAAVLATIVALLPALTLARLVTRRAMRWLLPLAVTPLFVSPSVIAVAGVHLLGPTGWLTQVFSRIIFAITSIKNFDAREPQALPSPIYTLTGVIICLAWSFLPAAILSCWAALRNISPPLEEAALLETNQWGVMRRVTLPLAARGIMAGALLVFLLSVVDFGVPDTLRTQRVLETEIYVQLGVNYNAQSAFVAGGALAVIALAATCIGFLLFGKMFAQDRLLDAPDQPTHRSVATRGLRPVAILGIFLIVAPMIFLFATLISTMNGPDGLWGTLWKTWLLTKDEFIFTMAIAAQGAVAIAVVGVLLGSALAAMRNPFPARLLTATGFFIPGSVTAIAIKMLLLWPPKHLPGPLDHLLVAMDDSYVPMIFAYVVRFAPLVALLTEYHLRQVPQDLIDATRIESASFAAAWRGWAGRAVMLAGGPGFLIVFALIIGESSATVILIPPGKTMLSVRLMTLMHFAPTAQVSALCLLMCTPALVVLPILFLGWEKFFGSREASLEPGQRSGEIMRGR